MTNRILRPLLTASAAALLSTGLAVGAAGAARGEVLSPVESKGL
jgi:hypothetical protein